MPMPAATGRCYSGAMRARRFFCIAAIAFADCISFRYARGSAPRRMMPRHTPRLQIFAAARPARRQRSDMILCHAFMPPIGRHYAITCYAFDAASCRHYMLSPFIFLREFSPLPVASCLFRRITAAATERQPRRCAADSCLFSRRCSDRPDAAAVMLCCFISPPAPQPVFFAALYFRRRHFTPLLCCRH